MTSTRSKDVLGRLGEDVAAKLLQAKGYVILARNWRTATGEIDIVARDGDCLVVVEVKTRRSERFGLPAEAVTPVKLARLRRLAGEWLEATQQHSRHVRIDVVAIMGARAEHVEHLVGVV